MRMFTAANTFGYSFCPDICPTNLGTIARALDQLGPEAARIQPLFISVDPDRDTPDKLRAYAALFHPSLIGLTGTKTQIDEAARSFRVYFQKVEGATPESYTMDHTADYFAASDHGSVIRIFDHETPPEKLAKSLKDVLSGTKL
ncbi:MAG: SCO family protein [Rhodospirillaceae bacterium]